MPKHNDKDEGGKHPQKNSNRKSDSQSSKNKQKDNKPSLDEVLFELIESVAKEEKALALLIRAEADKIQAFIGKDQDFPTKPCNNDILDLNHSVKQMLETIVMKEWLLLKKLENTLEVIKKQRKVCKKCRDYKDYKD